MALDAQLDADHALSVPVAHHPPGTWHFFNFTLLEEHKHLAVVVSATAPTASKRLCLWERGVGHKHLAVVVSATAPTASKRLSLGSAGVG